jgi:radical SAM superfamily enzyme YgiQ (UPF0313 family)
MFNNKKPNVILITDITNMISFNIALGPFKVAHVLKEHGIEVAMINHASALSFEEITTILREIISDQTLLVGINNFSYASIETIEETSNGGMALKEIDPGSFLPHGKSKNIELKKLIKSLNPQTKIVLGGPTAIDVEYNKDFDYIVLGYAETAIIDLVDHLMSSLPIEKSFKSIYGPIVLTDKVASGYNFSSSHMRYDPEWSILPGTTFYLEVGRGCIFKCAFCAYPFNGKKKTDYIRSKESLMTEMIDNYNKFGVTRYLMGDDTFNDNVDKCRMMYEISQQLPFKLEYWAHIRLDLLTAHPETIDYLFDSGLRAAFFGIETLNPKTASIIGKGGNRTKMFKTVTDIKAKWGDSVSLHGSFIYGLPGEDLDSLQQTTDFLLSDENKLDSWIVTTLNIRPNVDYDNSFVSDIEKNYEKYGYTKIDEYFISGGVDLIRDRRRHALAWKNEHTDYYSLLKITEAINDKIYPNLKVSGSAALLMCGLGVELDEILNKQNDDMPWNKLDQLHLKKVFEYKRLLAKNLNFDIKLINMKILHHKTYGNYLKAIARK